MLKKDQNYLKMRFLKKKYNLIVFIIKFLKNYKILILYKYLVLKYKYYILNINNLIMIY